MSILNHFGWVPGLNRLRGFLAYQKLKAQNVSSNNQYLNALNTDTQRILRENERESGYVVDEKKRLKDIESLIDELNASGKKDLELAKEIHSIIQELPRGPIQDVDRYNNLLKKLNELLPDYQAEKTEINQIKNMLRNLDKDINELIKLGFTKRNLAVKIERLLPVSHPEREAKISAIKSAGNDAFNKDKAIKIIVHEIETKMGEVQRRLGDVNKRLADLKTYLKNHFSTDGLIIESRELIQDYIDLERCCGEIIPFKEKLETLMSEKKALSDKINALLVPPAIPAGAPPGAAAPAIRP